MTEERFRENQDEVHRWIDELLDRLRPDDSTETVDLTTLTPEQISEAIGYAGGIHDNLEWFEQNRPKTVTVEPVEESIARQARMKGVITADMFNNRSMLPSDHPATQADEFFYRDTELASYGLEPWKEIEDCLRERLPNGDIVLCFFRTKVAVAPDHPIYYR